MAKSLLLPGFFASLKPAIPAIPIVQPVRLLSDQGFFLRTWTSVAGLVIRIQFRLFSPELDEEYSTSVVIANGTTGDRTTEFWSYDLSPIFRHLFKSRAAERPLYLLDFQCYLDSGAASRGACFVQAGIHQRVGSSPLIHTLFADYLITRNALAWPGSPIRHSVEGPGLLRSIESADPVAGAELTITVPTNARWTKTHSIRFNLVTLLASPTRIVTLVVTDGANELFRSIAGTALGASATGNYCGSRFGYGDTGTGTALYLQLPNFPLFQGWQINTITTNLATDDNFSSARILVEEHIEAI